MTGSKRRRGAKKKFCFLQGCDNPPTNSKKVKVIEQLDYEVEMELCSRHRNHFKAGEAGRRLDLNAFGNEMLLGESGDSERRRQVNDTIEYMQKHDCDASAQLGMRLIVNMARHMAKE